MQAGAQHAAPLQVALRSLVRTLGFIDVDILSVDYVARLFVLRGAARTRSGRATWSSARACSGSLLRTGLRFVRLIENLGNLVQRLLEVLRSGAQASRAALGDGFLGFFDGVFGGLDVRFRYLLAILAEHFLRLRHDAVEPIARFDFLHAAAVIFRVRFSFGAHLFGLFLG